MFCQDALASRWHSFAPRSHCNVAAQLGAVPCKAESSATSGGGADIARAKACGQGASQLIAVVHVTRSPPGVFQNWGSTANTGNSYLEHLWNKSIGFFFNQPRKKPAYGEHGAGAA